MIAVRCGNCQTIFDAADSCAGEIEVCPACGVENQIPADPQDIPSAAQGFEEPSELSALSGPIDRAARSPSSVPARGLPGIIWWTLALSAVGIFVYSVYLLFSDNWEQKNVEFLAVAAQHADVLMEEGDFAAAERQYQVVIDTVGNRKLQSIYLKGLLDRARSAEQTAENRQKIAATAPAQMVSDAASSQPSALSTPALAEESDAAKFNATRSFQRCSESFAGFLTSHPQLVQDDQKRWRMREFLAWEISYQLAQQAQPPQVSLKYSVNSRTTEPHDSQPAAAVDSSFLHDDFLAPVGIQSRFELHQGRWMLIEQIIDQNQTSASVKGGAVRTFDASILDNLVKLEAQAFDADLAPHLKK